MMFNDSVIDACLNRLEDHLGSNLIVRPPATAADLATLETAAGALPRDLKVFLVTCDGLRLRGDGFPSDLHLWHIHEMLRALESDNDIVIPAGLLPVRGSLDAECDFLVTDLGPTHGRVVRREPFVPGARLIASTFARYLDGWSRYLVENFDATGHWRRGSCQPFEGDQVAEIDTELETVQHDAGVGSWLAQLSVHESGGCDFE